MSQIVYGIWGTRYETEPIKSVLLGWYDSWYDMSNIPNFDTTSHKLMLILDFNFV